MTRTLLAASAALLLVLLLAPATLGADPGAGEPAVTDGAPTPAPQATDALEPSPNPWDGNGEIVIDPTFVTPSPVPAGQVGGATGRPERTPPATDTAAAPVAAGHAGLPLLLWIMAGGAALALVAGCVPTARRS